jgi:hypothetical protein
MGKLDYVKVRTTPHKVVRKCSYCQRPQEVTEDFFIIKTINSKIFELFGQERFLGNPTPKYFPLCPECFEKLKELLEDLESEGWEELDESSEEFKDLDEELRKYPEDGTGR